MNSVEFLFGQQKSKLIICQTMKYKVFLYCSESPENATLFFLLPFIIAVPYSTGNKLSQFNSSIELMVMVTIVMTKMIVPTIYWVLTIDTQFIQCFLWAKLGFACIILFSSTYLMRSILYLFIVKMIKLILHIKIIRKKS